MLKSKTKDNITADYFSYENGAATIWLNEKNSLDFILEVVTSTGSQSIIALNLTPARIAFSESMCLTFKNLIVSKVCSKRWSTKTARAMNVIWNRLACRLAAHTGFSKIIDYIDFATLKLIGDHDLLVGRDKEHLGAMFYSERLLFDKRLNSIDLLIAGIKGNVSKEQTKVLSVVGLKFNNEYIRNVIRKCTQSYTHGTLELSAYLYLILLISLRCRNESLQQIRLGDCYQSDGEYYIAMWQAKRSTEDLRDNPNKRIPRTVPLEIGRFIEKRKYQLIERFKNSYPKERWSEIPLFPRLMFLSDNSNLLSRAASKDLFNVVGGAGERFRPLMKSIRKTCGISHGESFFGSRELRMLVASELASRGFDARSIQLVLHHASPKTAVVYVDLHFNGLIDSISESFLDEIKDISNVGAILAFQSRDSFGKFDANLAPKTYRRMIESPTTQGVVESGSCSNICHGAPHACYECPFGRFIPFLEADHRAVASDWEAKAIQAEKSGRHNAELARTFRRKSKFILDVARACESQIINNKTESDLLEPNT